jgi:hypothetical protein
MRRRVRQTAPAVLLAAAGLFGLPSCSSSGGGAGDRIGPTFNAPTFNAAPNRETPTISPSSPTQPRPAAEARAATSRHDVSAASDNRVINTHLYEYQLYYYRPVNEHGQCELGLLLSRLIPAGWELYQIRASPTDFSMVVFRRMKVMTITPAAGQPDTSTRPAALPSPPSPTGGRDGTHSSIPPAPRP